MIVVDTCIIFHLFNESELHKDAEKLRNKDPLWIIPPIWQDEYANILAKLAIRQKRSHDEVIEHYLAMLEILKKNEKPVDKVAALHLAMTKKISAYDAHFVELARGRNIQLVTEDQEIVKKCPEQAQTLAMFLRARF